MKDETVENGPSETPTGGNRRPFRRQVAFVGPPGYFDASPTDFLHLAPDGVGVAARPVVAADAAHDMERAITQAAVACASCGADTVAVVGSNWSPVGLGGRDEMARFRDRLQAASGAGVHLAPLSMVRALRNRGVKRIAIDAVYATPDWRAALSDFFAASGFSVAYCGNLVDLGLVPDLPTLEARGGVFPGPLAQASLAAVLERAGEVDALVMSGIPGFVDEVTGLVRRMVHLLPVLQPHVAVPIITTDVALYHDLVAHLQA